MHPRILTGSILLLLLPIALCAEPMEPVQIVGTGKAQGMPFIRNWILIEPSIDGVIVPTRESGSVGARDIERLMRIYFPRTFEDLISYDFLFLAQVDMAFISPKRQQWMYDAIAEHGLGGVNTRSVMSMQTWWSTPWAESVLSDAFPNEAMAVIRSSIYGVSITWPSGPLVVEDDETLAPVARPFKDRLEDLFPGYGGLPTIPRPGSKVHTWIRSGIRDLSSPRPGYTAHIFEWQYNDAITFTFMDMVYDNFWRSNMNPFSLDIITNVMWRGAHRELPEDGLKVHVLRDRLAYYQQEKTAVISVFDFAETFGANTVDLYRELEDLDEEKRLADDLYLSAEFDEAYQQMEIVIDELNKLSDNALKLKDQALLWVYVIEYLAVAGTSMVCGGVLWFLMIKRSLYREAGVTRRQSMRHEDY